MLRDTIRSSEFTSVRESNEWLQRAVCNNLKPLKLSLKTLKRSLANSPLRSRSYVLLVDTLFLERIEDLRFQNECLKQALKVRPRDPEMLYLVGRSELQNGKMEKAIRYWKPAFERSRKIQERIAEVTTGQLDLPFFEEYFNPDWKAMESIALAYLKNGREPEAMQALELSLNKGLQRAHESKSDKELDEIATSLEVACRDLGADDRSIDILAYVAERMPHNYSVRYRLGRHLLDADRGAEAAEHLEWCARREPNNESLQQMATRAISERTRQAGLPTRGRQSIDQTGWKN